MSQLVIIVLSVICVQTALARPKEALTAMDVCKSIDSDKYVSQCTSALYKAVFDSKAVQACASLKSDYDKKSCIEVIRNKEYTAGNIADCKKTTKVKFNMCLKLNGVEKKSIPTEENQSTGIEN